MNRWRDFWAAFREFFKKRKWLAILIAFTLVFFVAVIFLAVSRPGLTPANEYETRFWEDVLPNVKGRIEVDAFIEKLQTSQAEEAYVQWDQVESGTVLNYYMKYEGEEGYYLTKVRSGFTLTVFDNPFRAVYSPDEYLVTYHHIPVRQISTNPKPPVNPWMIILPVASVFLLAIVLIWVSRSYMGRTKFLKSCAERLKELDVSFNDIAGIDEAKDELQEVVSFVKSPESYKQLGARVPKGVLLVGDPGNGKTMLAKAVATEAGVPFLSVVGSEFVEMYVGVGAARIRDLFDSAHALGKCIIFIDEVDSLARRRSSGPSNAGHEERETTLNQLLVEMDGVESGTGIVVIAATNRKDLLDSAFLRPGRIDREIFVDYPTVKGREEILKIHTKNKPVAENVNFKKLAQSIPLGSSGADLANIANEAAIRAGARHGDTIEMEDFAYAKDKVKLGLEKKGLVLKDEEKKLVAYHEVGHAMVSISLPNTPSFSRISIKPRSKSLGHILTTPEKDSYVSTREELLNHIAVLLGGRASEEILLFNQGSTGSAQDLKFATVIAEKMVCEYGMGKTTGLVSVNYLLHEEKSLNEAAMNEIKDLICQGMEKAVKIIKANKSVIELLVRELLAREDMDAEDVEKILKQSG